MHAVIFNAPPLSTIPLETDSQLLRIASVVADGSVSYNLVEIYINFEKHIAARNTVQQIEYLEQYKDDEALQKTLKDMRKILSTAPQSKHRSKQEIVARKKAEEWVRLSFHIYTEHTRQHLEMAGLPQLKVVFDHGLIFLHFFNLKPELREKPYETTVSEVLCYDDSRNNPGDEVLPVVEGSQGSEEIFFLGPEYFHHAVLGQLPQPPLSPAALNGNESGWLEPILEFPLMGAFQGHELLSIHRHLDEDSIPFRMSMDAWMAHSRENDIHEAHRFFCDQVRPAAAVLQQAITSAEVLEQMKEKLGYRVRVNAGMLPASVIWKFYSVNNCIHPETQAILDERIKEEKFQKCWPVLVASYCTDEGEQWLGTLPLKEEGFIPGKKKWIEEE